jgi:hypothetical protein
MSLRSIASVVSSLPQIRGCSSGVAQLKWRINFVGWVEVMRPNIYLYIRWVTLTLYPSLRSMQHFSLATPVVARHS